MANIRADKVALFGGTFDPIHSGHLNLAKSAADECGLDQLIFIPNFISPFKQNQQITSGKDRCAMIESILSEDSRFRLSEYELERTSPSYTYDTLTYFRQTHPEWEIAFIIGFDSVLTIDTWYHGEDILREYPLITGFRPGVPTDEGLARIEHYRQKYNSCIQLLSLKPFDASSSQIREMIQRGESITGLVPVSVEEYILNHELYRK